MSDVLANLEYTVGDLVVLGIIIWIAFFIVNHMPIPEMAKNILLIITGFVSLVLVVSQLGVFSLGSR